MSGEILSLHSMGLGWDVLLEYSFCGMHMMRISYMSHLSSLRYLKLLLTIK